MWRSGPKGVPCAIFMTISIRACRRSRRTSTCSTPRSCVSSSRTSARGSPRPAVRAMRAAAVQPDLRRSARRPWLAPGRLPARRAGERHGRRHRPVASLSLGRPFAVSLQPRRPVWLEDADPRPPRVGRGRPLPRQPGRGVLPSRRRNDRPRSPPAARARATTTCSCRRSTTSTACAPRRRRRRCRSICSRATRAVSSATPTTSARARRVLPVGLRQRRLRWSRTWFTPSARQVQAVRSAAISSKTAANASQSANECAIESVHSSSRPGVMKTPRFML